MDDRFIEQYAKLDRIASPQFIEPKAYVFVGYSRKRMNLSNMPSHESIKDFGKKLAESLGYETMMEKSDSRVVLLAENSNKTRLVNE